MGLTISRTPEGFVAETRVKPSPALTKAMIAMFAVAAVGVAAPFMLLAFASRPSTQLYLVFAVLLAVVWAGLGLAVFGRRVRVTVAGDRVVVRTHFLGIPTDTFNYELLKMEGLLVPDASQTGPLAQLAFWYEVRGHWIGSSLPVGDARVLADELLEHDAALRTRRGLPLDRGLSDTSVWTPARFALGATGLEETPADRQGRFIG